MKYNLFYLTTSLFILFLSSCKSNSPSQFSDVATARESFQKIATVADSIFWHATDKCLRENSEGLKQMTTLDGFTVEHECEIIDVSAGKNKTYLATVKIHKPKVKSSWFELTYQEAGKGWKAIDGKLIMDGHEMNYFAGQFLSTTNLKPYVDEATASLAKE